MKTLQLDGVEYVKASEAAKAHGYTSDYVGQLCRGGKIKAELVGRSWYVNIESLLKHRKNRYRSNQKKTKEAIEVTKREQKKEETPHYYSRVSHAIQYDEDTTENIPALRKVNVASEEEVPVEEHEVPIVEATEEPTEYYIEPSETERPSTGTLEVVEEGSQSDESEKQSAVAVKSVEEKAEKLTAVKLDETQPTPRVIREGLVPKKRKKHERRVVPRTVEQAPRVSAATKPTPTTSPRVPGAGSPLGALAPTALSLCFGLVVAGLMIGVGWHFEGSEAGQESGYQFSLASVTSAFE